MGLERIWMGLPNMGLASGIDGRMEDAGRPNGTPYKNPILSTNHKIEED